MGKVVLRSLSVYAVLYVLVGLIAWIFVPFPPQLRPITVLALIGAVSGILLALLGVLALLGAISNRFSNWLETGKMAILIVLYTHTL